jgi:hypothetical protein
MTMKEKEKLCSRKKTPKKDRKGDTPTAKQITSSAQKEKLPPPPQLNWEMKGGTAGEATGVARTERRPSLKV